MTLAFRYDTNGRFIESISLDIDEELPSNCTLVTLPSGLYDPMFVGGAWIEGESPENTLAALKRIKKARLDLACDTTIMGGFSSSALGVAHTYQSLLVDEIWLNATISRFTIDPNFTTVNYKTIDAGYLPHNKDQFYQVFIDGHSYGDSQISHLNDLKAKVDLAQSQADLDAITW